MNTRWAARLLLLPALGISLAAAAGPPSTTQQEIDHLLGFVGSSHCEFQRNGSWYDAPSALAHLRSKYSFLGGTIGTTDDFIDSAAARSSLTGQPYQVKCGDSAPVSSAQWLRDELVRFRAVIAHSAR